MPLTLSTLMSDATRLTVTVAKSLPGCSHDAPPLKPSTFRDRLRKEGSKSSDLYEDWLQSRRCTKSGTDCLHPGAHRPFTLDNIALASRISKCCTSEIFCYLWAIHPYRIVLMIALELLRGIFPAFRGYSQAIMVDELQQLITSGNFAIAHILRQATIELVRMAAEAAVDIIASSNENIVHSSARFFVERKQMEQRLRLDVPTLADPLVRDLLQECDMFVRSFNGFSAFGIFSPLDFMRLLTLTSELLTHIWVLSCLTFGGTPLSIVLFSLALSASPALLPWLSGRRNAGDSPNTRFEALLTAKQEAMQRLVRSDANRPEILLFDLGPWIMKAWSHARKALLGLERQQNDYQADLYSRLLSRVYWSGMFSAFQNVPLLFVLQSTSTSVGTFTLYRNTLQCLFMTADALFNTLRMAYQGIFLMGAFCATAALQPRLQPEASRVISYRCSGMGMTIDVRDLSFSYPGTHVPALKNVNFTLQAGETLAVVGYNGSGKTTLANVLLRVFDFDSGELLVNGTDIRRHQPRDFHAHVSAVFQGFSRFSTSVKGNVGIGYVPDMHSTDAVDAALALAGATDLVRSLPEGMRTRLDGDGADRSCEAGFCGDGGSASRRLHGLSGGEWQRIAISRAFMRARRPEVELLVFDEPTSSLDAHAQKHVFDTIEQISQTPEGERTKTVIFITHRLATARRADKIAMMEEGTIVEFGTHEQLLRSDGRYAALYHASV